MTEIESNHTAIGSPRPQTSLFIREPLSDQTRVSSDDDDEIPLARTFPTQSALTVKGTSMVGESSNGMALHIGYFTLVSQHYL
jgi:hypothetical protein